MGGATAPDAPGAPGAPEVPDVFGALAVPLPDTEAEDPMLVPNEGVDMDGCWVLIAALDSSVTG